MASLTSQQVILPSFSNRSHLDILTDSPGSQKGNFSEAYMEGITSRVIEALRDRQSVTSEELGMEAPEIHGALLSLQNKEQVTFKSEIRMVRELTEEGQGVRENGTEEYRLYCALPDGGASQEILEKYPIGRRHAFKNKWLRMDGDRVVKASAEQPRDQVAEDIARLNELPDSRFNDLKKRGLVSLRKETVYIIERGARYGQEEKHETELTVDMLQDWQDRRFKRYNFDTPGTIPQCGALHPLSKLREEMKKIFLEMGFHEMQTNRYVESSFWNFDSLFQPQNHPSRDAHDTFFLSRPESTFIFEKDYFEAVKGVHSIGGYGSIGHSSEWSTEEASRNVLRTHTTAVSSRYLKRMAGDFEPIRLFSIDKVFRNESVDATHLAEFHQVEGLIAGYDLGLGDLMGVLKGFFERLGIHQIRFKPAFNPYTEPSVEVFGYHEGLGKWIEIGNSGLFRPEMLGPMGYPEDMSVIAWGLSLERPAMIKYGLDNIRELVGHRVDVNFVRKSGFVNF